MMPHSLFRLQIMETFGNARHLAIRTGVSILLALPFIIVGMPARVKAAGIVMVVLFTTFFGAAVGHARLCEDRRFSRLLLLPMSRLMLWLDLVLSSAASRLMPIWLVVIGFVLFNSKSLNGVMILSITGWLCGAVMMLTLLGTLIGHAARSNGEVHLYSALTCVLIAAVSGIAPGIDKLAPLTETMGFNPLNRLLSGLIEVTTDSVIVSAQQATLSILVLGLFAAAVIWRILAGRRAFVT